jgi:hypothetical protein
MKIGRRQLRANPAWTNRDRKFVRAAAVFLGIDLLVSLGPGIAATSSASAFAPWVLTLVPLGFGLAGIYRALPYAAAPPSPGKDDAAAYRANPRPDVPPAPPLRGPNGLLTVYVWLHVVALVLVACGLVLVGLAFWTCGRH